MTQVSLEMVRGPRIGPKMVEELLVYHIVKNIFQPKFHDFRAKYFSSFRNFPPLARIILNTSRGLRYVAPIFVCMIFPGKIIIANISLPPSRNHQIKIEKIFLRPKLNAGNKPSNGFPPWRLVRLIVDPVIRN